MILPGIGFELAQSSFFPPWRDIFYLPTGYLVSLAPPALLVSGLVVFWRPQTIDEKKFRLLSLSFYGVVATVFILLFILGGVISLEERQVRSAGTLLVLCALISAFAAETPAWIRGSFLVKGRALLSAFRDYTTEAWERRTFAEMSVYFQ